MTKPQLTIETPMGKCKINQSGWKCVGMRRQCSHRGLWDKYLNKHGEVDSTYTEEIVPILRRKEED